MQAIQRYLALCLFVVATCVVIPVHAQTDNYPNKPITIVVPYLKGFSDDLIGRLVGNAIAKKLGVSVEFENVTGIFGSAGAQKVSSENPDGYTLLLGSNTAMVINPLVRQSVKYKASDFTPIGLIATQPMVLVASNKSGIKNVNQLMNMVKGNTLKLKYGTSGVGSVPHLAMEMFNQHGALVMSHYPYRGSLPITSDLKFGSLDLAMFPLFYALPLIKSGDVVALGTTELKRTEGTPDIAALAEHPSLEGFNINSWFALFAPANLPQVVSNRLQNALSDVLLSPALRQRLESLGFEVATLDVDMPKFLAKEISKYQKTVDIAKIKDE